MGTKINTNYYGASDTWRASTSWGTGAKCSKSFKDLVSDGSLDLVAEDDLDVSCIPWGMPTCSASSMATPLFIRTGLEHSGSTVTEYGSIDFEYHENERKNVPLMICGYSYSGTSQSWASGQTNARSVQAMRLIGQTKYNGTTIVSSNTVDDGSTLQNANLFNNGVVTYLDYQTAKIVCGNMRVIDLNSTAANTVADNISITSVTDSTAYDSTKKYALVGFTSDLRVNNNINATNIYPTVAKKFDCPPQLEVYFGGSQKILQAQRDISTFGHTVSTGFENMNCGYSNNTFLIDTELSQSQTASYPAHRWCTQYLNASRKKQVFDDVSYHWEVCYKFVQNGLITKYTVDGQPLPHTGNNIGQTFTYMVIDDCVSDNPLYAFKLAILHELAFLGFPIVEDNTQINLEIGDNGLYLPVFDIDHMITTGKYVTGAECASLPNSLWNDIFDDGIPNWDSTYEPPEGGDVPEGDSGDLHNRGLYINRFSNPSYTVWAFYGSSLGNNGLDDAIAAINNLYITDPDGNDKWTLDFKGSNPSDYIVGLYAYPLAFQTTENSYVFTLGAVEFDTINVKKYADDGYFSFGSIDFDAITWYGDFRDYPPYSTAELYIPFCGTVDIDLAFFIGHSMTIDMYYDIYTGACSAAIYRDNITLYKVVNGQIGVQLPLTSMRAGDYQNNIHALENALKQNEMRIAASALTLGLSAGAAVATGGASLAVGAGVVTGSAGLLSTMQERDNIEYKLDHTQPAIAQTGAAETQNGYRVGGIYPMLFIKRAAMLNSYNADKYGHTVGFATVKNTTIGAETTDDKNSLIVCSNADLSGLSATAAEISAIQTLLTGGIYV